MTDRELLELAAKAAGIEVWFPRMADGKGGVLEPCHTLRNGQTEEWNPLEDDGDALRLAAHFGFFDIDELLCRYGDDPLIDTGKDLCAAIRRAIVRAAAEIGRNMQ